MNHWSFYIVPKNIGISELFHLAMYICEMKLLFLDVRSKLNYFTL